MTPATILSRTRAPIIHHPQLAPLVLRAMQGRAERPQHPCPAELTVVTCKNYPEPSLLEQSMELLGAGNPAVILRSQSEPWVNIRRTLWLLEYLDSGRCTTPYLMVSDASDVVVRGSLASVLETFRARRCRVLFMSTYYDGGYACMPAQKRWVGRRRYLNAGVYIGETAYIRGLLARIADFIVDAPLPKSRFSAIGRGRGQDRRLCDEVPDFPRGLSSDQIVLRWLEPELFPDLQVDCDNEIAFRNAGIIKSE